MGQRKYDKVGSADDVQNVNPYTQGVYNANQGMVDNLGAMIYGQPGQQGGYLRGLMESGDPEAAYNWFLGAAPQFQQLAMDYTNPFVQGQRDMANVEAANAVRDVAAQFGGPANSYYSGAAANAMLDNAAQVRRQMMNNVIGAQTQAAGSLMNNALGTAPGAFAQQRAQSIGLLGNAMGAHQGALNNMTALGAPEWWQPTYVERKNAWDYTMEGLGAAGSLMGGMGAMGGTAGISGLWS